MLLGALLLALTASSHRAGAWGLRLSRCRFSDSLGSGAGGNRANILFVDGVPARIRGLSVVGAAGLGNARYACHFVASRADVQGFNLAQGGVGAVLHEGGRAARPAAGGSRAPTDCPGAYQVLTISGATSLTLADCAFVVPMSSPYRGEEWIVKITDSNAKHSLTSCTMIKCWAMKGLMLVSGSVSSGTECAIVCSKCEFEDYGFTGSWYDYRVFEAQVTEMDCLDCKYKNFRQIGAVFGVVGSIVVQRCDFEECVGVDVMRLGGDGSDQIDVENCTFTKATCSGALVVVSDWRVGVIPKLMHCVFRESVSSAQVVLLHGASTGTVELHDCIFEGCVADLDILKVDVGQTSKIFNCVFKNCHEKANEDGMLHIGWQGEKLEVSGCRIEGCTGAARMLELVGSHVSIADCVFADNTFEHRPIIFFNRPADEVGDEIPMARCRFEDMAVAGWFWDLAEFKEMDDVRLASCSFVNITQSAGARVHAALGIALHGPSVRFDGCTFSDPGHDDWTSILDLRGIDDVQVVGCEFKNCEAHDDVVRLGAGTSTVSGCTFSNCSVSPERQDSAIVKFEGGVVSIEGSTFEECRSGALSVSGAQATVTVSGCKFFGEYPPVAQVLILASAGTVTFSDCCFTSAVALSDARVVHIKQDETSDAGVEFKAPMCFDRRRDTSVAFSKGRVPWKNLSSGGLSIFQCEACLAVATWEPEAPVETDPPVEPPTTEGPLGSSSNSPNDGTGGGGLSDGAIAGVVMAVLVVAVAVAVVVVVVLRRRRAVAESDGDECETRTGMSWNAMSTMELDGTVAVIGSLWQGGGVATRDEVEDGFKGLYEETSGA